MIFKNLSNFKLSFIFTLLSYLLFRQAISQSCPPRCLTCKLQNETMICNSCLSGFFLNSQKKACEVCAIQNCLSCSSPTICKSCFSHEYLNSNTCKECNNQCNTCKNTANYCQSCSLSFFSTSPSQSGICITCEQPSCSTCQTNPSACTSCRSGHYLNLTKCVQCQQNCIQCSNSTICQSCKSGYGQINGICNKCNSTNCLNCDSNINACNYCSLAFILNKTDNKCYLIQRTPKIANDKRYGCLVAYNSNSQLCYNCDSFYYQDGKYCRKCSPGCLRCTNNTVCYLCVEGFALINSVCFKCPVGCLSCSSTECNACQPGYSLQNGLCQGIKDSICLYLNLKNSSKCNVCRPGFTPGSNGKCIQCQADCFWTCNPSNISECRQTNFQLENGEFYNFGLLSEGCKIFVNGNCQYSQQAYNLVKKNNMVVAEYDTCFYPCDICNSTTCLSCVSTHIVSNGKCIANISCNPSCSVCPEGTQRNYATNNCDYCSSNCQACVDSTCLQCYGGYYLQNNICKLCPSHCHDCFDASNCITCGRGYFHPLNMFSNNEGLECIKCSTNCFSCLIHEQICTSCQAGLTLQNNRCIKPEKIIFSYNINSPYLAFVQNSTSDSFITTIADFLSINSIDIYITGIKDGSTIISGYATTSSPQLATSMYQKLKNTAIPGFTVNSYTVSYNNQITQCPQSSCSGKYQLSKGTLIGIIVGSVVAVVLLSIICCSLVKKCRKKQQKDMSPVQSKSMQKLQSKNQTIVNNNIQINPTIQNTIETNVKIINPIAI